MHELQAAHFQFLDRRHVNLRHVMLFVAGVDVFRNGLCFSYDELLSVIRVLALRVS